VVRNLKTVSATTPTTATGTSTARRMVWVVSSEFDSLLVGALVAAVGEDDVVVTGAREGAVVDGAREGAVVDGAREGAVVGGAGEGAVVGGCVHSVCSHTPDGMLNESV
jgi:hypothetical protein